jgi:capsule polysaccharide modification protein KpsS
MIDLFARIQPDVIVGGFDALHGGLALAVARSLNIPWLALNFSVIPPGVACFCDALTPAARVQVAPPRHPRELADFADESLRRFENRTVRAPAYIEPAPLSIAAEVLKVPARLAAVMRRFRKVRARRFLQFTESVESHSVVAAWRKRRRAAAARKATADIATVAVPPAHPYVVFGLHTQPESSIDVWAPFFSNQMWVVEVLARSIPPTHKLLVKIHKSDVAKYSREQLERLRALPGVDLVRPFADTQAFIEKADLVVAIQGTMGLEGALLGRPVIMLGDSPVTIFPSASSVGALADLPALVRRKLAQPVPSRQQIVQAYAAYLAPFSPASHNDWTLRRTEQEIDDYVRLFGTLKQHPATGRQQRV